MADTNVETTNKELVVENNVGEDVSVETSEEVKNVEEGVVTEEPEVVEEKPSKKKKSSKKTTEEETVKESEEESMEAEEDAASEASEELNIMDDAKTSEENENEKAHFYKFRKEGFLLELDPNGFVSTILMKKFRFGVVIKDSNVDFESAKNKCLSFVKTALNKLHDEDIVVREIKSPTYLEPNKFYNVISVHVPFHSKINEVEKEMKNTISLLNNSNSDGDGVEFLIRIGNYADLIVDSTKQSANSYVCFKGFQSLTYSKTAKRSRESISAGIYASENLGFKQKDISYVNKSNLNICKMNMFGKNVKFEPISHHDINFGKRFGVIIYEIRKEADNFKMVRYICDVNLRDYKAFNQIFVTDGVKTTIKKEEFEYGMALPQFESIFQGIEGNSSGEILCTMLGAPRTDPKWEQFDNDVDIIDRCMFTGLEVE